MNQSDLERLNREIAAIRATVELILHKKTDDPLSQDIEKFAAELSENLPDKISVVESSTDRSALDLPGITIACGGARNIHYLCVPEQNEIVPFAHALTFAAQGEAPLSSTVKASVNKIKQPAELIVLVSPFCTNCPLVVEAVIGVAVANPLVAAYIIDVQHVGPLAEQHGIQSVPATIIDQHLVHIGEIDQERLVEILLNRGTEAYKRDFMRSLIDRGNIDEAADRLCEEKDVDGMLTLFEEGDLSMRMGVLVVFEEALEKDRDTIQKMIPNMIAMLTNEDARIRGDIADLLGKVGDPRALPHLEPLTNDSDPDVVDAAEEAIELLRSVG